MIRGLVGIAALSAALFAGFLAIHLWQGPPVLHYVDQDAVPSPERELEEAAAARRAHWSHVATMGGAACICTSMGCLLLIDLVVLLRVIEAVRDRRAFSGRWTTDSRPADDWEPVRSFGNDGGPPDEWAETLDADGGARPDEGGA